MAVRKKKAAEALPALFHHKWSVPALAALHELGGGAKFVTLQSSLGTTRDSLRRTLAFMAGGGLVTRNPGYGHPMRPEYVLTPAGRRLAPACARLVKTLEQLKAEEVGRRKWVLPVALALATAGGRFNRMRAALGGVTPRALASALRDLRGAGIVERLLVDDTPPRTEYRLTRRGKRLTPAVRKLAEVS